MQSSHAVNFEIFIKSGTASTAQGKKGHPSTAGLVTSQYSTATAMWEETLAYGAMGSSFNTATQAGDQHGAGWGDGHTGWES